MVKANRQQEKTNFLENPDNVAIGDWVKYRGKIGKIEDKVETGPRMLKYWVQFIDGGIEGILAVATQKQEDLGPKTSPFLAQII